MRSKVLEETGIALARRLAWFGGADHKQVAVAVIVGQRAIVIGGRTPRCYACGKRGVEICLEEIDRVMLIIECVHCQATTTMADLLMLAIDHARAQRTA